MKKSVLKIGVVVLSASLLFSAFGCGKKEEKADVRSGGYGDTYPLNAETPVKWWTYIDANITATANNLGDTPFGKKFIENVGADITFIHPTTGGGSEQFNLMLASGELPDIIDHYWTDFPGGPEKAIKDGYIVELNDLIDKYAPNFKKYMEEHPDFRKYIETDNGSIYMIPYINAVTTSGGVIIRQDWLDELGLEMPETIDEWYTVLKAFKEKKGATAPLSIDPYAFSTGAFSGAYGIRLSLYVDNGTVKYGYYEDAYKDFLTAMNQWYNEGLLDNNFSTLDSNAITANVLNGSTGVSYGGITSGIAKYMNSKKDDPTFRVVAAPYPTSEKGKTPEFGQYVNEVTVFGSAISSTCKDPELAMRLIDYTYSEEGIMLNNYGIEGESYNIVDGKPVYTDEVMNNDNGLTMGQALSQYAKPYNTYNSVQLFEAYEQTLTTDDMKNALKVWGNHNGKEHSTGTLHPTAEEQKRLSEIQNAISTYTEEMRIKFICGVEPISNFDTYKQKLEQLGIKEYLQMQQAAYDRFAKR